MDIVYIQKNKLELRSALFIANQKLYAQLNFCLIAYIYIRLHALTYNITVDRVSTPGSVIHYSDDIVYSLVPARVHLNSKNQ